MNQILSNIPLEDVKAAIFDLDGTLIDTERIYRQIWPKTMASLGYVMKDDQYLAMRSLGRPFAPKQMKEWFGEDFDYDNARKVRSKFFNEYIAEHGIQRKKGAIELLDYLKDHNIVTAIATATDVERAVRFLKMTGLDGYFDKVISATDVAEGKPSPYVYQHACKELGLSPEVCVAFEDAPNGIRSAHSAGLRVVMIPDQTEPDESLNGMYIACLSDLESAIQLFAKEQFNE